MSACFNSIDESFAGRKVLVMGLGHFGGGVGVTRFLIQQGATVTVTDTNTADELTESVAQLADLPITFHLGDHQNEDFIGADVIVVNPAVPKDSTYLALANQHGTPVTTEMNIFFQRCPAPIIGVTGSNGKSTIAAMIAHILRTAARQNIKRSFNHPWLGGNIGGEQLICNLEQVKTDDVVVLELSSFQLDDLGQIKRSPHIAVLSNIAPNHLDRHRTMEAYVAAKQNIVLFQSASDYAVFNRQDGSFEHWPTMTKAQVRWYPTLPLAEIELPAPGKHNQINAAAAVTAVELVGIEKAFARSALSSFEPLPHRLELVGRFDGVAYYDDSVATTPQSVMVAIDAFPNEKILILGGYDKKVSFSDLINKIVKTESIRMVICIGQMRETLTEQLEKLKEQTKADGPYCKKAASLKEAVEIAKKHARNGMVVLLSPGCASYDMFRNFQERGVQFRRWVTTLTGQIKP